MTLRDSRQRPLTHPRRHRATWKGSHADTHSHLPGSGPPTARRADEHTRESGRIRGAAQGCPPTWSLHLHIQGFGGRKAQTAFSPLRPPLGGTGAPSSALCWREAPVSRPPQPLCPAGGNCETPPPPRPAPCACTSRAEDRNQGDQKGQAPRGLEMEASGLTLTTRKPLLPATAARPPPAHTHNARWTLSRALIGSHTGIPSPHWAQVTTCPDADTEMTLEPRVCLHWDPPRFLSFLTHSHLKTHMHTPLHTLAQGLRAWPQSQLGRGQGKDQGQPKPPTNAIWFPQGSPGLGSLSVPSRTLTITSPCLEPLPSIPSTAPCAARSPHPPTATYLASSSPPEEKQLGHGLASFPSQLFSCFLLPPGSPLGFL